MTLQTSTRKASQAPAPTPARTSGRRSRRGSAETLALTAAAALAVFQGAQPAQAHMEISNPPPRRSKFNSLVAGADIDYNMNSPLPADGSGLPCKRYAAGASVATYRAGSSFNVTAFGSTFHGGGHCQFSLSYNDQDFVSLNTVMNNCFVGTGLSFPVTIPATAPAGKATLAWTWVNAVGNRELYMNCADVTITNTITPLADQKVTGQRTVYANQPGYTTIPEFGTSAATYNGADLYASAPVIVITASGGSTAASASPSPAAVAPSASSSAAAVAASPSPSASASRAPASTSASSISDSKILDYLRSRGEALDITVASPVRAVYADYRDSES